MTFVIFQKTIVQVGTARISKSSLWSIVPVFLSSAHSASLTHSPSLTPLHSLTLPLSLLSHSHSRSRSSPLLFSTFNKYHSWLPLGCNQSIQFPLHSCLAKQFHFDNLHWPSYYLLLFTPASMVIITFFFIIDCYS